MDKGAVFLFEIAHFGPDWPEVGGSDNNFPQGLINCQALFSCHKTSQEVKCMAKNEPNMPDEVKTGPANELPAEEKAAPVAEPVSIGSDTPTPEVSTEETALPETGKVKPFSGEVVVPFDKINEIVSEKQATAKAAEDKKEPEAPGPEEKAPDKKALRKGRPPKADLMLRALCCAYQK